jgi:transglutaminase-like putative cysteine protease
VISSRTGDSTEAAILAVGCARALGLPARLVAGFVYWEPGKWPGDRYPKGAFAFHVWAEIYAGENLWHPVDPTRMDAATSPSKVSDLVGHGGFDATHVAVLRSDVATTTPFTDIVLPVLEFMDGLRIEVLEPK